MTPVIEEAKSEIRNACVSITGLLKEVDLDKKTLLSAWFEMMVQDERIKVSLKVIKENL